MCNGTDVWKTQDFIHNAFHSDWLHKVDLERYCCLSCGFIAEYISQEDLADAAKMERIRSNFHKA